MAFEETKKAVAGGLAAIGAPKAGAGWAASSDEATASAVRQVLGRGLRRLYRAHQQGSGQAKENSKLATAPELRDQLTQGAQANLDQATRLEKVFRLLDLVVVGEFDPAMQGIIDDNKAANVEATDPLALDLTLISSGQLAAHHYVAAYGTLRSYCEVLSEWEAARLLGETLKETLTFDEQLTALARRAIVRAARAH